MEEVTKVVNFLHVVAINHPLLMYSLEEEYAIEILVQLNAIRWLNSIGLLNCYFSRRFWKGKAQKHLTLELWGLVRLSFLSYSVQSLSRVRLCNPVNHSTPGLPVHHQLPEFTQTHIHWVVIPANHLILCRPLLLLPSIIPSIRLFSNESVLCIRWPKYWSFSFNISPSNEHPGMISFRMDRLALLTVQGTLKSLLQHHSSKASILLYSAFFIVQLSHPYMTTGKTIASTR